MDVSDLRCFVAVAEELHFGRAAERLVYTKSHVSQIIARLERELGLPLFVRTSRQVQLTAEGGRLVSRARAVLEAVEEFRREAADLAGQSSTQLRVAYAPATGTLTTRLVAECSAVGPDTALRLEPRPSSPHVIRAVVNREVELGIAQWTSPEVEAIPLSSPAPVIHVPVGHRLASRTTVTVADLDHEAFILPQRDVNAELFDATLAYFANHGVKPDYRPRHITSPAQLIELVLSGQGLAFGSAAAAPEPGLMQLPLVGPGPPGQTVYLLWRRGPTNPLVRRILRTVRSQLLG